MGNIKIMCSLHTILIVEFLYSLDLFLFFKIFISIGDLAFWKLGYHFQFSRASMLVADGVFRSGDMHLMTDYTVFTVQGEYHLARDINKKAKQYRYKFSKLKHVTKLVGIGKSSLYLKSIIYDPDTDKYLGSFSFKYVCVDRKNRRSAPVPSWILEKYAKFQPGNHLPKSLRPVASVVIDLVYTSL